jgi:hypothetical protein
LATVYRTGRDLHGIAAEMDVIVFAAGHPIAHGDVGDIKALGEVRNCQVIRRDRWDSASGGA